MGEAKRNIEKRQHRFNELDSIFHDIGISNRNPGFYDDPLFIDRETTDPSFLEKYAEWVNLRPITTSYGEHVTHTLTTIAPIIVHAFDQVGGVGRCVDVSNFTSRCLERLGIYNYIHAGGFKISLRSSPSFPSQHLWVFDQLDPGAGQLGHVWVVAPPFNIVDLSIKAQGWVPMVKAAMPEFILEKSHQPVRMKVDDMVSNEVSLEFSKRTGIVDKELHFKIRPSLRNFTKRFPGRVTQTDEIIARYLPSAVRASDEPLHKMPADWIHLYNTDVAPAMNSDPI